MPSFDTVCDANMVDVKHAVENTTKEITTRFDFKGTPAAIELKDKEMTLIGDAEFQITQIEDILRNKLTKRNDVGWRATAAGALSGSFPLRRGPADGGGLISTTSPRSFR